MTSSTEILDRRIIKFIEGHHVMTLATVDSDGTPYCTTLFYAYMPDENALVFSSDNHTRHYHEMAHNNRVAAAIALETKIIGKIQGVQITGCVELPGDASLDHFRNAYLKKFPYAALSDLTLWVLHPDSIKLTDNRLGFGKKIIWHA